MMQKMIKEQDKIILMKKSEDEQIQLKQEFKQNLSQKESELKDALKKLDQINQVKLEQVNLMIMELQNKHINYQVSEGGKLVIDVSNSYWFFCLCEQAIPMTGKVQFAFNVLGCSHFMVGIGIRDVMENDNYYNCYQAGTYLIKHDGLVWSHHNKNVHSKQLSFVFTNNDIIIIEVSIEHKQIKWSRQNNPEATVSLDIDTQYELYPCVGVANKSKIKILDQVQVQ